MSEGRRASLVRVSSLNDLSKISPSDLWENESIEMEEYNDNNSSYQEVPGAWTGGLEECEDEINPIDILKESSRRKLVTSFVLSIISFIGILFLTTSLINGGLPRYGVEEAEKIFVHYDIWEIFPQQITRNGQWEYYRFQTHHTVENITAVLKVKDDATINSPLAVYLSTDVRIKDALDVNGTSILQGSSIPDIHELNELLYDDIIVCGPRTVYISITLPYWSPATSSLGPLSYELQVYRTIPDNEDDFCVTERLKSFIFINIMQPIAVSISIISCILFLTLGLYDRHKLKKLTKNTNQTDELFIQD